MLNIDEPLVRLQDWEIQSLLAERKKMTPAMLERLSELRLTGQGHRRQECEVVGEEGSIFRIMLRQNLMNPQDWCVILAYVLPDTGRPFRLRRYDSPAEHRNRIERSHFTDYHIHMATARYQARGFDEEGYAEPSDRFADLHGAVQCLFMDCGCELPPNAQTTLFPGGRP